MTVFDRDPAAYEAVRPGYPAALVDDVIALSRLPRDGRILEVGCGTGQATRLFAARGCRITAVEPGPALAAATRAKVPGADVRVGRFEELPLEREYALVMSATAWHWIDPLRGYARAHDLLLPGGVLALFWNEHVLGDDDVGFFDATQDLYEQAGMSRLRHQRPRSPNDRTPSIVESDLFGYVVRRQYPWRAEYDAPTYARLLGTYSDHILLADDARARLLDGIAALIDSRFGGRIVKHYVADLYVARML
ncbi:MAG: SAM-dependent methyltransferase [bacterium]|nr:SAM-dependent methyltransferase [bacterium]